MCRYSKCLKIASIASWLLGLALFLIQPAMAQSPIEAAVANSPEDSTNTLNGYKLAAGDRISIDVFGETELSVAVQLNESGIFNYPYLGRLQVLGKTLSEVQQIIVSGLKGDYLIDPKVSVTMESYREIYISGEVVRGGSFPFRPGLSVSKAIALAGGFTERAARSRIKVVSESTDDSDSVNVGLDYVLKPGDVITVPRRFF